jgi:hypothetical protein
MSKYCCTFACLLCLVIYSSAQTHQSNFQYSFSDSIKDKLQKGGQGYEVAQELSFIGDYTAAQLISNRDGGIPGRRLTPAEYIYMAGFTPVQGIDHILNRAKTAQIVIINEAHQQPCHRVLTTSLLQGLYMLGFRYFGAETLLNNDSVMLRLNHDKFPVVSTGYYTREPFYGNLVRQALGLGFEVFAYETTFGPDSVPAHREMQQAKNIKKILDRDPSAKILIHCGWAHLYESAYGSWGKAMAGRLREYTGIDPLTIDQTEFTEHVDTLYDSPWFGNSRLGYPAVFIDSMGKVFNGGMSNTQYDIALYMPRTHWVRGRPHWVFGGQRAPHDVSGMITIGFPCLVMAYLENEWAAAASTVQQPIPFDIIELKKHDEDIALSLEKGAYIIEVKDTTGRSQKISLRVP